MERCSLERGWCGEGMKSVWDLLSGQDWPFARLRVAPLGCGVFDISWIGSRAYFLTYTALFEFWLGQPGE